MNSVAGAWFQVESPGEVDREEIASLGVVANKPWTTASNDWMSGMMGTPWCSVSINSTVTSMIGDSLRSGSSELDLRLGTGEASQTTSPYCDFSETHLEILTRFQSRTSLTVGGMKPLLNYVGYAI